MLNTSFPKPSVFVVVVVLLIPLADAASITNEDKNAQALADRDSQRTPNLRALLRCWQLLIVVLSNHNDTQPPQPSPVAAGAMVAGFRRSMSLAQLVLPLRA